MKALTVVKNFMTGTDDLGSLIGERDAAVAKLAAAREEILRLEEQRLSAESFDDAEAINRRIARVQWTVDQINSAVLPQLNRRITESQAIKQRDALLKHQAAARAQFFKLKAAIENAGAAQAEAIAARQSAERELGGGLVQRSVPVVAYMGLLLPDLIEMWVAEQTRVFAAPAPQPAVAAVVQSRVAPTPTRPVGVADRREVAKPVAPVPKVEPVKPKRPLRKSKVAVGDRRLIVMLRPNVEIDSELSMVGDQIDVPTAQAESLVKAGCADYVSADAGANVLKGN
jgi:hypothetical protein